jgi:hypothetical protein
VVLQWLVHSPSDPHPLATLIKWCDIGVKMVLQWCHSGITVVV